MVAQISSDDECLEPHSCAVKSGRRSAGHPGDHCVIRSDGCRVREDQGVCGVALRDERGGCSHLSTDLREAAAVTGRLPAEISRLRRRVGWVKTQAVSRPGRPDTSARLYSSGENDSDSSAANEKCICTNCQRPSRSSRTPVQRVSFQHPGSPSQVKQSSRIAENHATSPERES